MNTRLVTDHLNQFWHRYAESLRANSATELVSYYEYPALLIKEDFSQAITSEASLITQLDHDKALYRQRGALFFQFQLVNVRYLSPQLLSVDVLWLHLDTNRAHLFDRKWTYILRWHKDQSIKICVAIEVQPREKNLTVPLNSKDKMMHVIGFVNSPRPL